MVNIHTKNWDSDTIIVNDDEGLIIINPYQRCTISKILTGIYAVQNPRYTYNASERSAERRMEWRMALDVGNTVHELLQTALIGKIYEITDLEAELNKLTRFKEEGLFEKCESYVHPIQDWLSHFVRYGPLEVKVHDPNSTTATRRIKIIDFTWREQSLWSLVLGVDGRMDVTVEVNFYDESHAITSSKRLPLEIKTGATKFTSGQKAQVMLYTLMMKEKYGEDNVADGGLLLHLMDGSYEMIFVKLNRDQSIPNTKRFGTI